VDGSRKKILDLAEEKSAVAIADSEHATALVEAREQVMHVTLERDGARARVEQQTKELDDLREQINTLRNQVESTHIPSAELEESGRQIAVLTADRDLHLNRVREFMEETASQQERPRRAYRAAHRSATRPRRSAHSLSAAQKQIEQAMHDRDAARGEHTDKAIELEAQLAVSAKSVRNWKKQSTEMTGRQEEELRQTEPARELAQRYEQQRLDYIDLAARLDAAQREIIELTASLAEARLQKYGARISAGTPIELPSFPPEIESQPEEEATPVTEALHEPLTEKETKSALGAMRRCFQRFTKQPSDLSLLNELHAHAHAFSERAPCLGHGRRPPPRQCVSPSLLTSSIAFPSKSIRRRCGR
jgi:chromosome segregation ATPase